MEEEKKKSFIDKIKEKSEEKKKKKLIEKIKKKDEAINKNKEEIKKMALELKDGKLVKKEENKKGDIGPPPSPPNYQQPQPQPMQQPQPQPQPMPSGAAIPQPQPQPQQNPFDNAMQQQKIPEQQFANQPTGPQNINEEEMMQDVPINFILVNGMSFQFVTKLGNLKDVLTYVAESINNQEIIELGHRLLNPRHILFYEY